jgi:hypothetical protein
MRQILPGDEAVIGAVAGALVLEALALGIGFFAGGVDHDVFENLRLVWQFIACLGFGTYRVATFHPANVPSYFDWLKGTPWTPRQPLPMGPVHLTPQDVVVIAASMGLARIYDPRVLYLPLAFIVSYLLIMATTVWMTGQKVWAYVLGLSLCGVLATSREPATALCVAFVGLLLTVPALRGSLRAYPWTNLPDPESWNFAKTPTQRNEKRLGWPFDQLAPREDALKSQIEPLDVAGVSLLSTAAYAAWLAVLSHDLRFLTLMMELGLTCYLPGLIRLAKYTQGYNPPISFLGRFTTWRPWQRGYDEIFLVPLGVLVIIVVTSLLGLLALAQQNPGFRQPVLLMIALPFEALFLVAPGGVGLAVCLLLGGGPHLNRWRLAGRHQIVFDVKSNSGGLGQTTNHPDFLQTG